MVYDKSLLYILLKEHDYLNFLLLREQLISPKLPAEMKKGDVTLTKYQTRSTHSVSTLTYFIVFYGLFIYHFILIFLYTKYLEWYKCLHL